MTSPAIGGGADRGSWGWVGSIGLLFRFVFEMDGIGRRDKDGWFAELQVGPSPVAQWPLLPVLRSFAVLWIWVVRFKSTVPVILTRLNCPRKI
jgi:hypothetical protein